MQISVNGTTYDSWDDVPEELRAQLARTLPDADHNGVPDLFEGDPATAVSDLIARAGRDGSHTTTSSTTSVEVDGTAYSSLADLPGPLQDVVRQALGSLRQAPAPTPTPPPLAAAPGQVVLNGVPVDVVAATREPERKGFFRRLFG